MPRWKTEGEIKIMDIRLPKTVTQRSKRVGRGFGSGKGGHTTGRGQKGQKARGKIGILFEGTKVKKSLIKKLPLSRGKGKFHPDKGPIIVKLELLNLLPSGTHVDVDTLIKERIVREDDAKQFGVKVLGNGTIKKKLIIEIPISKSATRKIERSGGKVITSLKS